MYDIWIVIDNNHSHIDSAQKQILKDNEPCQSFNLFISFVGHNYKFIMPMILKIKWHNLKKIMKNNIAPTEHNAKKINF